jgi:hypothetical protein
VLLGELSNRLALAIHHGSLLFNAVVAYAARHLGRCASSLRSHVSGPGDDGATGGDVDSDASAASLAA